MLLTRKNPVGGRPLGARFPIDEEDGTVGYKLGYCPCGEKILVRMSDAKVIANNFATMMPGYDEWLEKMKDIKPTLNLKIKLIKFLGGRTDDI